MRISDWSSDVCSSDLTPNGRDLFALALAKHGLSRRDVAPNVNLFRGVRVGDDGSLELAPPSAPGSEVVLRCDLDVLVTIVNVPHPNDDRPAYTAGRLRVTAWPEIGRASCRERGWPYV